MKLLNSTGGGSLLGGKICSPCSRASSLFCALRPLALLGCISSMGKLTVKSDDYSTGNFINSKPLTLLGLDYLDYLDYHIGGNRR